MYVYEMKWMEKVKKCYMYNYLVCFKENVFIVEMYSVLGLLFGIFSFRFLRFGILNLFLWEEGYISFLV